MKQIRNNVNNCEGIDDEHSNNHRDFMDTIDINRYPECVDILAFQQEFQYEIKRQTKNLCQNIVIIEDEFEDLVPYLLPGSEAQLLAIGIAQEQLRDTEADFLEYAKLLGDFSSTIEMSDVLYNERNKIRLSKRIAKHVFKKGLEMYPDWSPAEVHESDFVQWNERWAERIERELDPVVDDLYMRLTRAYEILAKYN